MKKYINILKGIGLCENSAKIYLGLLELGLGNITKISNITTLHRTQIYRLLPNLVELGYVIESLNGKRKLYFPVNPEKIYYDYEKLIKNQESGISELKEKYKQINKKTTITLKNGKKGIKSVYDDLINTLGKGGVFYRITSEVDSEKIKKIYQPKNYLERRDKKEIERFIIMSKETSKQKIPKLERDIKIIDSNLKKIDDNIIFTIYGDKVSLIDFNTETSIIIENIEIAKFQKKIFQLLFEKLN